MANPNPLPQHIARFEILERIAIGGMAEVYLACDRGPHGVAIPVVVKRILGHLAENPSMVRMFVQEARIASRIHHPNVVQILELGEHGGLPYIAMEYVPGSTVRELAVEAQAHERPIPVAVALHLVLQACSGVHAAHELRDPTGRPAGLVHRDVSPHNLMVDAQAHVKVLDFGIAKAEDEGEATRTGVLKGKIRYMSPEQCRQEPLDRRSDVFSLGIVLWELLAGRRMFDHAADLASMQAIISGDRQDLRELRPELPGTITRAVDRALALDREARFPTADAMRRELTEAATEAGLLVTADPTVAIIEDLLGAKHESRRAQLERALNRTGHRIASGNTPRPQPTLVTSASLTGTQGIGLFGAGAAAGVGAILLVGAAVAAITMLPEAPAEPPLARPGGTPLRIALAPVHDPAVMLADHAPLIGWLEQEIDRPIELVVTHTYAELPNLLVDGGVDFAVLPPAAYIEARALSDGIEPVAMKQFDGSSGTDGVLLVHEDSDVGAGRDLKGRTVCLTDPLSTTGYMLPRAWLRTQKVDPDRDLNTHLSGNHLQALRDLASGKCVAAGTYSGAWLVAEARGIASARFRVIALTGRTPHDTLVAGPGVDRQTRTTVGDALLRLDPKRDLGVERIGETERITGFVPPDDTRFDDLRRALAKELPRHEPRR